MKSFNFWIIGLFLLIIVVGIYFIWPKSVGDIDFTDPKLNSIKEKGYITIGMDLPYGVMEFYDEEGNFAGIDVDIGKTIADSLNVEAKYVPYSWDDLFIAIYQDEVDLAVSSMTITSERSEKLLFSDPYFNAGQVIIIRKDTTDIGNIEDLIGKNTCVQAGTTGEAELLKYINSSQITSSETVYDSVCNLEEGKIDAIVLDYVAGIDMVLKSDVLKLAGNPFTEEFYGIATNLENKELINHVNGVLRELKRTGEIKDIENKWTQYP